jgi:hypothetical protein
MRRTKVVPGGLLNAKNVIVLNVVLLAVFIALSPAKGLAKEKSESDFTLTVRIKGMVSVSVRDLATYVRAAPVAPGEAKSGEPGESITLRKGDEIKGEIREGLDIFRFAEPVAATMKAPIYLGKKIRVESVLGEDLSGKKVTIRIPEDGMLIEVTRDGTIGHMSYDVNTLSKGIPLVFDEEVIARTRRITGVKPFRKRSFELLDRWVSAGEEIRIKVPMPDYNRQDSQVAVGFWTDHPDSGMEDEAYLADVTGIEQEKGVSSVYRVKVRVPSLGELSHVTPGWYCPYPPKIKMTVTAKLDETNIVTEHFDLRVARRGWGIAGGVIFLVIAFLFIMRVTKDRSPFERDTESDKKYRSAYKSNPVKRFLFSPFDFSLTPIGTYSISKTQALFWTCLVAFSCVYVYILKASFLMVPGQMLILLGLTGGTALASRINAASNAPDVPKEIMDYVKKKVQEGGGIPRLRDMVSIGGRMNIYKFQMVVFTIITGIIVFVELIKSFNFPEIPESLIILMGVSNSLYLGNEVAVDPLKKVREMAKEYGGKRKQYDEKRKECEEYEKAPRRTKKEREELDNLKKKKKELDDLENDIKKELIDIYQKT